MDGLAAADRARDEHLVSLLQALEAERLDAGARGADELRARDTREDATVGGRSDERVALADEDVAAAGPEPLAREVEDERLGTLRHQGAIDPLVRAEAAGEHEETR